MAPSQGSHEGAKEAARARARTREVSAAERALREAARKGAEDALREMPIGSLADSQDPEEDEEAGAAS